MNQVKLICERLLKEQETRLRYEYETVLNRKLEGEHLLAVGLVNFVVFREARGVRSVCA